MKTTIVCGLLGSGKTSFIRNYLKDRNERAVVLVNDFGQAGIDGEILSAGGIESVELPSGCVCCTLKADLITTIRRIISRYSPDHLLIEPSGVASPSGVLEALESASIGPATVVGIVDAVEFTELYNSGMYGSFFREQIELSDVILVNKADLADESLLTDAERLIGTINPLAVLLRAVNAAISVPLPDAPGHRERQPGGRHLRFETLSFRLNSRLSVDVFKTFFDNLAGGLYGSVARAKALIQTDQGAYRFDSVYGKVDRTLFERDVADSRLVVIGEGLDEHSLSSRICAFLE